MNSEQLAEIYAPHLIDNDPLSDSAHNCLDEPILAQVGAWNETIAKLAHPASLAILVVAGVPTLNQKFWNVQNMLTQMEAQPDLQEAFIDCWKIQKFKTFRRFSEF